MSVSADVAAKQSAYAAKPYAARVETSHFSGTFRFDTAGEAIDYIFQSAANVRRNIREWRAKGERSWVGFDARRSYVEGPAFSGRVQARFVLMQDSFDSNDY